MYIFLFVFLLIVYNIECIFYQNYAIKKGGHDNVLYYGSRKIKTRLKKIGATNNYEDAAFYGLEWSDYDFEFGSIDNEKYIAEQYPHAFDKLKTMCYIHYVATELFDYNQHSKSLYAYTSSNPVPVLKYDTVPNVYELLLASKVRLIKFNTDLQKIAGVEKALQKNIKALYVPADLHHKLDTSLFTENIIFINDLDSVALNKKILELQTDIILIGDPIDIFSKKIKFDFVAAKYIVYQKDENIKPKGYISYMKARAKLFRKYIPLYV